MEVNDIEIKTHREGRWDGAGEAVGGEVEDGEVDQVLKFIGDKSGEGVTGEV